MNERIERRYAEIRAAGEDRTISGTAIVFNTESQLLEGIFTEIISPEAVSAELITKSNIVMLFNHEDDQIPMARSKYGAGTLKVSITATGVDFSFDARTTPNGDEILAAVRSKDVDSCSFAFTVAEGGDQWMQKPDGTYLRTITKIEELYDFSLVNSPAYVAAACRSLDKFKAEQRTEPPTPPADPPAPPSDPPADPPADPPSDPPVDAEAEINAFYAPWDATITEFSK